MSNITQARIPWEGAGGRKLKHQQEYEQHYPGMDPLGRSWWEGIKTIGGT